MHDLNWYPWKKQRLPATLLDSKWLLPEINVSNTVNDLFRVVDTLNHVNFRYEMQDVGLNPELQLKQTSTEMIYGWSESKTQSCWMTLFQEGDMTTVSFRINIA